MRWYSRCEVFELAGSSPGMIMAWAVMPSFKEFREEMALPSTELGPLESAPLARLASCCAGVP